MGSDVLLIIGIVLFVIMVIYKTEKYIRHKVIERKACRRVRSKCKGHYGLVQLEGNLTRWISGNSSKTTMVFWYDPKEEQKIFGDRI